MEIDVAREHAHEDHSVGGDGDDLGDRGIGILVAYDEVVAGVRLDLRRQVIDMGVGEPVGVHSMEVDPQVPGRYAVSVPV